MMNNVMWMWCMRMCALHQATKYTSLHTRHTHALVVSGEHMRVMSGRLPDRRVRWYTTGPAWLCGMGGR